jgi:hypothetical protein
MSSSDIESFPEGESDPELFSEEESGPEPYDGAESDLDPNSEAESESEPDSDSGSDTENRLCHGCGGTIGLLTTVSLSTFSETALSGCPTCPMIRDILKKYAADFDRDINTSVIRGSGVEELLLGCVEPKTPEPMTISVYGHDDPNPIWLAKMAWEGRGGELSSAKSLPDIIGDTGSDAAMALAKKWIANCERDHPDCQHQKPSLLPKRIVDLGGLSSKSKIRLYETSNEPAK